MDYPKSCCKIFRTDYEQVNHRRVDDLGDGPGIFPQPATLENFPYAQVFDHDGLKGRLLSSSSCTEAGQPNHEAMLTRLIPADF